MKQIKPFAGKWRIVQMEVWDQDYIDMEVPGFIRIGSDGTGRFQFGLVSGDIDGRVEQCGRIYLHLVDESAFRAIKSK